jgi:hypothetical protein
MESYETNSDATDMAPIATTEEIVTTDGLIQQALENSLEVTQAKRIAELEATIASMQQKPEEAPKNLPAEVKQVDFQVGPIDKWVTGGGTKSHIKNPA